MVFFKGYPFSQSWEAVICTPNGMELGQMEKRLGSAEWTSYSNGD